VSVVGGDEIVLSGPPGNVSGLVALDVAKSTVVPISISAGGASTVYRAIVRPAGTGQSEIRLKLPSDTAPGVYTAEATFDGKPRRIAVRVEPVMRISVEPRETKLTAAATSSVDFGFTVTNSGNVPFVVPEADVFDLDDHVAQDRALGRTLRAPLAQGERRVDRFFDELLEAHGGEAHVAVRRGAGRLEPGESRELACVLDVPPTARAGRSYLGPWQLGNTAHLIVADITTPARPEPRRTKR